jgi:VanZ family protein
LFVHEGYDSTQRAGCASQKKFNFIVCSNPWSWIAAVFALHVAGSAVVVHLFELRYGQVALPIFIAAFGAVLALAFRRYDRSQGLGEWKWWLPVCIYALFIFALSSASYKPGAIPCSTKDFHVVEYSVLGVLLCRVWSSSFPVMTVVPFALRVLPIGVLYAASDEIHQSFVPGRNAAFSDVLLDLSALCVGVAVFVVVRHVWSRIGKGAAAE